MEARKKGDLDAAARESSSRQQAEKVIADSVTSEADARKKADAALSDRQSILSGTLILPAGLALIAGKTPRVATVPGVKLGDNVNITLRAALPSGLVMSEVASLKDGEVTIYLYSPGLITLSSRVDIPFTLAILRPAA